MTEIDRSFQTVDIHENDLFTVFFIFLMNKE